MPFETDKPTRLLATVYEKQSARGNRYFTGRLPGGDRVLVLRDHDQEGAGDPRWRIYRQQDDGRPSRFTPREITVLDIQAELDLPPPPPRPRRRRKRKPITEPAGGGVPFDDGIPDLA